MIRFVELKAEEFDTVWGHMEESFPYDERRDKEDARAVLSERLYRFYHIERDGMRVGFITVWSLGAFCYVEHFAVYREFRGTGIGLQALELAKSSFGELVLEVEPPETEQARRRIGFYRRAGLHLHPDFAYLQPSYHGGEGVPLLLMSYPTPLSDPKTVARTLYKEVYRVPYISE